MKQRIARALDWRNLGWRSPAWLHLVAVLGVCAVQAGCAGSVDSGSGAAAATGNGASPYDVGAIAPSSGTDPGTTASSSGTKLYVVAEGSRINVTVAGSSTP
ncbi:MAG: hypothetical protein IPG96_11845 [Proteobacteria bacterium]|nr:hypothetical protein [Pseudomonadota bacterium]